MKLEDLKITKLSKSHYQGGDMHTMLLSLISAIEDNLETLQEKHNDLINYLEERDEQDSN